MLCKRQAVFIARWAYNTLVSIALPRNHHLSYIIPNAHPTHFKVQERHSLKLLLSQIKILQKKLSIGQSDIKLQINEAYNCYNEIFRPVSDMQGNILI